MYSVYANVNKKTVALLTIYLHFLLICYEFSVNNKSNTNKNNLLLKLFYIYEYNTKAKTRYM